MCVVSAFVVWPIKVMYSFDNQQDYQSTTIFYIISISCVYIPDCSIPSWFFHPPQMPGRNPCCSEDSRRSGFSYNTRHNRKHLDLEMSKCDIHNAKSSQVLHLLTHIHETNLCQPFNCSLRIAGQIKRLYKL